MDERSVAPPPTGRASREPDATAPDGSEIRLLATGVEGARRASLCEVRLAAGAVSRPVSHRSVEEIWYVLEGRGQVWRCPPGSRADPIAIHPGDAIVIPATWAFQFAAGGAPLRFLCYTAPPWPGPDEAVPAPPGGLGEPTV
jgi:mannose-6-phosphate isomerase-like protein (cupin superfamily)